MMLQTKEVDPKRIIETIANEFNVTTEEMKSRSRKHRLALPRQVAMYILREEADISFPQIGEILGGRDHTTVIYGCEKINDLMETDDSLRKKIIKIREGLYGPIAVPV
jgi:chromosomal replication initiator protein